MSDWSTKTSKQDQKAGRAILLDRSDAARMRSQKHLNLAGRAIAPSYPHNVRSRHGKLPSLLKIRILGHDGETVIQRKAPHFIV